MSRYYCTFTFHFIGKEIEAFIFNSFETFKRKKKIKIT